MAERLLKKGNGAARRAKVAAREKTSAKAAKVAAKGYDTAMARQIVLVATYKERQLAWVKKNGVYNYPVKDGDEFDADAFAKIKELWLYADAKGRRHCFAAEFAGKMTRDEFIAAYPSYAKLGKSRSKAYYVFKTSFLTYGPSLEYPDVLTRAADFGGRSAKVKKAIAAFKADGEFGSLADYLPSDLSQIPHDHLCVCEAAVQLSFWDVPQMRTTLMMENSERMKRQEKNVCAPIAEYCRAANAQLRSAAKRESGSPIRVVELFAGVGGFRIGLERASARFETVWNNQWEPSTKRQDASIVYQGRFGIAGHSNSDISTVPVSQIPRADLLVGGFPCQDYSVATTLKNSGGIEGKKGVLWWQIHCGLLPLEQAA